MSAPSTYTFKVLLLGDPESDKTGLFLPHVHSQYNGKYLTTIGFEPYTLFTTIDDNKICLSIWDIAHQMRYQNMREMFFRANMGVIIVFDLDSRTSFESVNKWAIEARESSPDTIITLIGRKNTAKSIISYSEVLYKAQEIGASHYFESDSLSDDNIKNALLSLARIILSERSESSIPFTTNIPTSDIQEVIDLKKLEIPVPILSINILRDQINLRSCCAIVRQWGESICGVCGKNVASLSSDPLSNEMIKIIYQNRYCCILSGRNSWDECRFCKRDVPSSSVVYL